MIVHLIDGTYELFRHFYGLRRRSPKDTRFGAVAGVLRTVIQMLEDMRRRERQSHRPRAIRRADVGPNPRNCLIPRYKTANIGRSLRYQDTSLSLMVTSKRSIVPFSQIVQPIIDEPLEMRWRLDFADWLQLHGNAARARWIRECCAVWDTFLPLALGWGTAAGPIMTAPWGIIDLTNSAVYRWHDIRPGYWAEIEGCTQTAYFGRIVFTASDDAGVDALGKTPWLPEAYSDGWLESIYLRSLMASQLKILAGWPKTQRQLPLFIDTTYFSSADINNDLMRETLNLAGLQGIVLSESEMRFPCVKQFAELAPNLCYLWLYLKAIGTSLRLLEQLGHLKKLRSLLIGGSLPNDSSLALLTKTPNLQTLRLYGRKKITDTGLQQLTMIQSLRVLALDLPQVSRSGIESLRSARPDLNVRIEGDMRNRLGPV